MANTVPGTFRDGVVTITDDNGNSEVLYLPLGDQALDGLLHEGAVVDKAESQGHLVGLRLGARAYPTFSVSAIVAAGLSDFEKLALGKVAANVSTSLSIGDAFTVDLDWSFDYGAESRSLTADDCLVTIGKSAGSPNSTVTLSFDINGPVALDGIPIITAR